MSALNFPLSHESLEKDYELLLLALNASKSGIILTDSRQTDNPIIFANTAFETMTGYRHNEIIGRNCRFLQGNDRNQKARFILAKAVETGDECTVELRNYRKDGSQFWNELFMSPIKDKEGTITHFIGVQNNITRRKKAESALHTERELLEKHVRDRTRHLKESEEYLSVIIETIRESLLVLNKEFTVISANAFFYKTFALTSENVIGKSLYDMDGGVWDIPDLRQLLEVVLPHNNPFEGFEVSQGFPDIGNKHLLLNARRIDVSGDYKDRILLAIEDVTEFKENESRKDDFLSIASHELRTPLTSVMGYNQLIEMLMDESDPDKLKDMLAKSNDYIEKLDKLIEDLLDVSRIQAGHIEINKSPFDFDEMIRNTVENVQTGISTHTIHTKGDTGIEYDGDKDRLEQVMTNLLHNAAKYSPNSKDVYVEMSLVSDFIKVSVTDFGVGIKQVDQKKIFERFYRVKEIQQDFAGIGIGLYVCENIIKEHQGTLWVESEPDKGATFSFTLPVIKNNGNEKEDFGV